MADSTGRILSSTEQMQANYEKYKDKFVDSDEDLVNADTFLQLLVGEMKYQDPLEPTSNTEFLSQLASFSQMGYMQDASKYSMATYASSLVGKVATATRVEGKNVISKTGIVESVARTADNKSYTVTVQLVKCHNRKGRAEHKHGNRQRKFGKCRLGNRKFLGRQHFQSKHDDRNVRYDFGKIA